MKATFVIETGERDANGDKIDLSGMKIPKGKVPVLKDFNEPISEAEVFIEDGVLKATAEIPEELIESYPAIGYELIKRKETSNPSEYDILKSKLRCIGIGSAENVDPKIKKINEQ